MTQFEIWKGRPEGVSKDHWFVLISTPRKIASNAAWINGLICYTLRGDPKDEDVRLDYADGFAAATVVPCDFMWALAKGRLSDRIGLVSFERQIQIKAKVKQFFRL